MLPAVMAVPVAVKAMPAGAVFPMMAISTAAATTAAASTSVLMSAALPAHMLLWTMSRGRLAALVEARAVMAMMAVAPAT